MFAKCFLGLGVGEGSGLPTLFQVLCSTGKNYLKIKNYVELKNYVTVITTEKKLLLAFNFKNN